MCTFRIDGQESEFRGVIVSGLALHTPETFSWNKREDPMSSKLNISRRDFINGFALSVAAGSALSPLELFAQQSSLYPPALTGLRGSHSGSFEGRRWRWIVRARCGVLLPATNGQ
jgi:hypothetical protein